MDYTQQTRLRIDRCEGTVVVKDVVTKGEALVEEDVVKPCRKLAIFWTRNTVKGERMVFCGGHGGALANTGIEMFPLHYATNGKAGV